MNDYTLETFAKTDGSRITPEALYLLQAELVKRGLDISLIERSYHTKTKQQEKEITAIKENNSEELTDAIWQYALENKYHGASNAEIKTGLYTFDLTEDDANYIMEFLGVRATDIADKYDNKMLRGGVVFIVGILITIGTYAAAMGGGSYLLAYGPIIFGIFDFFNGLFKKKKYQNVANMIQQDAQHKHKI